MTTAAPIHPSMLPEEVLLSHCRIGKGRSGGPGGQHRNKVETLVEITHEPTGIAAHAGERRSASENKRVATTRLRLALATQVRTAVPLGDARTELWRSRCRNDRIECNPEHFDYPALLAEAMNMIEACNHDAKKAALRLCCSASQLIKLVQEHPPAFSLWNARRLERGLHALK